MEGGTSQNFTAMNDEVDAILDEYNFGGVILFAENVSGTEQTARLTEELQASALQDATGDQNKIPMLIGIDQEGGIVYRLGTGTALPGNMALGATRSSEYAKNVGQIIGRELSSLGINVNFAPSMDVNNNPRNAVIGLRSFSSDPNLVARLGVATIQGLKEYNIAGAAKHFPGHGDTEVDSHYGLPKVDKSLAELKAMELVPFQAAMDEGIDMIMTAHMMFPQLDDNYPATLSKKILTDLVRTDMGYEGIVITDAMNMKAIVDNFGEIEATILAIESGVDISLMPTILRTKADVTNKLEPMVQTLVDKADSEPEFMTRVNESVKRVLELKEKRGILDYEANKLPLDEKIANAKAEVGSEANRNLERQIARDAVTVTKNENNVLPYNMKSGEKIVLFGAYANELPGMEFAVRRLIAEGKLPADIVIQTELLREHNGSAWIPLTPEQIEAKIKDANYVVAISEIGNEAGLKLTNWLANVPTQIMKKAKELGVDATILSISKPYDVANYPDADGVVAVYGAKGMDPTEGLRPDNAFGPNIPAGIEIILGNGNAQGTLPVDIPLINENHEMTDEIAYKFGFGLSLNEPAESITLSIPKTTDIKDSFNVTVDLGDMQTISDDAYSVQLDYDAELFELVTESDAITVTDVIITVNKEAGDVEPIILEFKAKEVGENLHVISSILLIDAKDRIYIATDESITASTITVTKADDPVDPVDPVDPTDPTDPKDPVKPDPEKPGTGGKLPATGIQNNHIVLVSGLLIGLGAVILLIKKRKSLN